MRSPERQPAWVRWRPWSDALRHCRYDDELGQSQDNTVCLERASNGAIEYRDPVIDCPYVP